MKKPKVLLSCLISIVFASVASATWIPLTDNVPLSSLQGGSLVVGDKKFSEIEFFSIGAGGAIAPDACSVFVQGALWVETGDYGLRFLLLWNVESGQTINADLNFKVSVLTSYDDYFIKDISLFLLGASVAGTGTINVGENVWDEPLPGGDLIASLSCSKQESDGGAYLMDYAEFVPLKEIWVRNIDISMTGGTSGAAHFSEFFQFYSQIPEPATVLLLGLGGILLRRKIRNQK